jgi:hypothetical protein
LAATLSEIAKNTNGMFTQAAQAAYLLRAPDNTATKEELQQVADWMEQLIQLASAAHMVFIGAVDLKIKDGNLILRPVDDDPVKMVEVGEKHGAVFSDELKQKAQELQSVKETGRKPDSKSSK